MSITFLKLAYIAEFGIAFNLAFGEFKHDTIAKTLNESFSSIDKVFMGNNSIAAIYKKRDVDPRYHTTLETSRTKNLKRLDHLRSTRSPSNSIKYNPLNSFFDRVLLFSTHPVHDREDSSFWSSIKRFPKALLVSWVYSKNPNWNFSSCSFALWLWSATAMLIMLIAYLGPNLGVGWGDFRSNCALNNSCYLFAGVIVAMLAPRPLSAFMAGFLGRKAIPRGRYYAVVLTILIVLLIVGGTYLDATEFHNNEAWWFSFGFLITAALHPILLFGGYLSLETAIDSLVKWVDAESNLLRTKSLNSIEQYIQNA